MSDENSDEALKKAVAHAMRHAPAQHITVKELDTGIDSWEAEYSRWISRRNQKTRINLVTHYLHVEKTKSEILLRR